MLAPKPSLYIKDFNKGIIFPPYDLGAFPLSMLPAKKGDLQSLSATMKYIRYVKTQNNLYN